jgi:ubiquinone/menaquinone biosynthesis C-methylase UbiE
MWNSVAEAWERNADFVDAHMAAATEAMLDAAQLEAGDAVLDLASGPGGAGLAAAARVGAEGSVVLADVAAAMVETAARRSAGLAQVATMVCDQNSIDAPDENFDAVICRHGLMFAEPPVEAVAEARRVLKKGGRYAAITWDERRANPWLGCVLDAVGAQFGVEFPPPTVVGPFAIDSPARLSGVLQEGGLEGIAIERISTPMHADSFEAWWDRVPQLAGPLAQALAGMEPDVRDSIRRRALEAAEAVAQESGQGIELPGSVLVGSGHTP